MANSTPSTNSYAMHHIFSLVFASAIWIGGGSVGLLLVVIVVVLFLRR
jgi:hypothetical protein